MPFAKDARRRQTTPAIQPEKEEGKRTRYADTAPLTTNE
jgi:hypothetical protein